MLAQRSGAVLIEMDEIVSNAVELESKLGLVSTSPSRLLTRVRGCQTPGVVKSAHVGYAVCVVV
jgi:hypothetical protein